MTTGELLPELRKIPFRTVISMEVIEHLHSPRTFAAFVRSILEANGGGRFILTTPYHGYLKNLSIALAGKADRHYSALWEGGHIKFWSRRTLAILLREAGFRNMPSPARGASRTCGGTWCSAPKRRRPRKSGPATRLRNRENPAAVPAGGAVWKQMPPKQRGDGTETAQRQHRVWCGSSTGYGTEAARGTARRRQSGGTETAGRRHGDGRAAARR